MAGTYGIETFPDSNGPLGVVTGDPELSSISRGASPAFPNNGVYFPAGEFEAVTNTLAINWPGQDSGKKIVPPDEDN